MTRSTTLKVLFCLATAPAAGCLTSPGMLGNLDEDGGGEGGGSTGDDGDSATSQGEGDSESAGDDSGSDNGSDNDGDDDGPEPACTVLDVGVSQHRVLDRHKWANAIADLLPESAPAVTLAVDNQYLPFYVGMANANAWPAFVDAANAVANSIPAGTLACAGDEDACVEEFINGLAPSAWRRSLSDDEVSDLMAVPGAGADARIRGIIVAVLTSPLFYDITGSGTEDPQDADRIVLNGRSIATRLAHLVWNSVPDAQLIARAEAGELSGPDVRREEVQRMLDAPQARRMAGDYAVQWLRLDSLPAQNKDFAGWTDALAEAMITETRIFAGQVFTGPGTWAAMLSASTSAINGELASLVYGEDIVGSVPAGASFEPVEYSPERRGGIYSLAAFNAKQSHADLIGITHRGLAIRRDALCAMIPPPPPRVDDSPPEDAGKVATRHEFQALVAGGPACESCHRLFDPITFALDHYDAIGRWQDALTPAGGVAGPPNTIPVDPHGEVVDLGEFDDRQGLMQLLTDSEQAGACVVRNNLAFVLGRLTEAADACTVSQLSQSFADSGGNLPGLMQDIAAHDSFLMLRL